MFRDGQSHAIDGASHVGIHQSSQAAGEIPAVVAPGWPRGRLFGLSALLLLASCGGGSGGGSVPPASNADPTIAQRTQAVDATVADNALCNAISAYSWQIGDGTGALATGTGGTGTAPTNDTEMLIASASKWLWGAYVAELRAGTLTAADVTSLTMNSGYAEFQYTDCIDASALAQDAETVEQCFEAGDNSVHTAAYDNKFFYSGGHFQKQAAQDLNLGNDDNLTLQLAIASEIGVEIPFTYNSPQLAAGGETSGNGYAVFLRKILNNQLKMHDLLGADAVCTNPATCATAVYSPVNDPSSAIQNESWHYSIAHWVEDDPNVGDGAFSSTGAFGFYPWIDKDKTTYGVMARYSTDTSAYIESVQCGRLIRKAWFSAQAQ